MPVKRVRLIGLVMLFAVLGIVVASCSPSPKSRADDLISYLPEEFGDWELDDTVKLLGSTVSNKGQAILTYEGTDDALAYIVIEVFPSEDAAEVAAADRERQWLLAGMELDSDRAPGQATADVAQTERAWYALFQEVDIVIEVNALAADDTTPVSEEAFGDLLTAVRAALEKIVG